jgi:glutamate decarboxylase
MKCFANYSDTVENPLFIWRMCSTYEKTAKWTLYDLQDKLKQSGWMVPAYTLPKGLEKVVVMRVVVRHGFSRDMAAQLLQDIREAVTELDALKYPTSSRLKLEAEEKQCGKVYTH